MAEKDKKKKKVETKKVVKTEEKKERKGLKDKFMTFCHGVKSEFKKVRWPTKNDMVKYSIATIVFIISFSIFFYLIDVLFALIQSLIK